MKKPSTRIRRLVAIKRQIHRQQLMELGRLRARMSQLTDRRRTVLEFQGGEPGIGPAFSEVLARQAQRMTSDIASLTIADASAMSATRSTLAELTAAERREANETLAEKRKSAQSELDDLIEQSVVPRGPDEIS